SASGGQSERSLDMVGRTLRGGGPQVSFCGAFIVGAVKMLGTEGQIALAVPFRGPHMQLTPAGPQHGRIGAACQASGDQAFELIELGLAPNKGGPIGGWWIGRDSAQAPNVRRYVKAFERHLAQIVAKTAARKRAINRIGQQSLARSGSRHE